MIQAQLFAGSPAWPTGFAYAPEFLSVVEEAQLREVLRWKIDLEPRSAYLMRGAARWQWQHALSPTRELRYSITFRTRNAQKHRR